MQGKRVDRVAELVRHELGNAIVSRLRDPRIGFVTITHVELSTDLHYAKVFYSVLGNTPGKTSSRSIDQVRKDTHDALTHARGFLQKDLAEVLNLRYTPHLDFVLDDSLDQSMEINGILKDISEKGSEKGF